MGTTFINDALRRIELALGRGDHERRARAARRGARRRRRQPRAAVDRPARLAARRARAPHRRPRRRPRRDRRRARPARLLLAGRRADGARGRHRRARRGRRRRARARPRRGPGVRGRQRRGADRARRGVRGGRAAGRGGVPGQRPRRAGARRRATTIRRCGPPPVAAWEALGRPYRAAQAHAPQGRGAAGAAASATRRPPSALEALDRRAGDRRRAGWPPRSRASRCARGCGWSPTSLRRHPRQPPRMPAKTRSGSRRASARCWRSWRTGAPTARSAQALYMAEKTASVHVSRILSKLDVRSRTEAAAVAHRVGLV